jgi:hypothetical protein
MGNSQAIIDFMIKCARVRETLKPEFFLNKLRLLFCSSIVILLIVVITTFEALASPGQASSLFAFIGALTRRSLIPSVTLRLPSSDGAHTVLRKIKVFAHGF